MFKELKNVEAVIFDLDGTLVDSMWMWEDIDREFLSSRNIELPVELQQQIEGMSFTETAHYFKERFHLEESVEHLKETWNDMAMDKYMTQVPMKKGALRFLQELKENGIKMGIATSNSRELVEAVCKVHGIRNYINCIVTSCDVERGKPAPDVYLKVAADLQVEPRNCMVFEDIPMGIQAGQSAGMRVCAVADEHSMNQILEIRRLANYYIKSYEDIFERTYEVLTNE